MDNIILEELSDPSFFDFLDYEVTNILDHLLNALSIVVDESTEGANLLPDPIENWCD